METYNYFYQIKNKINGNYYYGVHKTNNLEDGYMGSGKRVQYAIKKYGIDNFVKQILLFFDTYNEALNYEEEFVTEELILDPSCYNIRTGGRGGFTKEESLKGTKIMLNKVWSDSKFIQRHKKNHSKLLKELHKNGKVHRVDWTGKRHSQETKKRIGEKNSIAQKGEKNSQYGTCWVYNDIMSIKIKKDELPLFISNGWNKGRRMKF